MKKMFVDDPLYLFLLTQIGYRAAELDIVPAELGARRYIGWAWQRRKREIADKKKAEAATVADNNESEDEDSIQDPNESEEHRAKRRRIYQEDRKTRADRDELEHERGEARRERVRAIMAARDEEERQRNEAGAYGSGEIVSSPIQPMKSKCTYINCHALVVKG